MRNAPNLRRLALSLLLCAAGAAAGCSEKMRIDRYPDFYSPDLRTIAVLPLANETRDARAGRIVTDRLVEALKANGTYKVIAPQQTLDLLAKADVKPGAEGDAKVAARALGKLGLCQIVLTGRVEEFGALSTHRTYIRPEYWYDGYYYGGYRRGRYYRRWNYPYYGWPDYSVHHTGYHEGNVSAEAALLSAADGSEVFRLPSTARATVISEGDPPDLTPAGCLDEAARACAWRVVDQIAVVSREIEIKPKEALRIAKARTGPTWQFDDDFRIDDEEMFVVVALPAICDRNVFRLEITRKGQDAVLAEQELTWSSKLAPMGVRFSPRKLAADAGPGTFEVHFRRGSKTIMSRKFHIED